ncbi:hypothetical protein RUM43_005883 [Polyplax serrata]|uniref:E3 ubiquitin-protein ligase parkin n=1 Tax=Polyplax serrata TaxID=468196 RepID=A0AAN8S8T5_POLSC
MTEFLFTGKRSGPDNSVNINVKSNVGGVISVNLDPKWDIKNVKEIIAPQLGLNPDDVKIIFAGKELLDTTVIEECDLGEQSILHVVKVNKLKKNVIPNKPLCETLEELQLNDQKPNTQVQEPENNSNEESSTAGKSKAHFYVYCANPCKKINPGKLRVCCSECKYGAFTVDGDPQSWADVLHPKKITGICNNVGCKGTYAEFYFKCATHPTKGENDKAVPLNLIRRNNKEVPCLACTDISDPVLVFPCDVGHVTCLECFKNYCVSRLRDRQFLSHPDFGYTLPCPAGCSDSFIEEVHHFRLLGDPHYEQYHKFAAEEYILQAGGVLCPQPGCGEGILIDDNCTRVQCNCGYVFCAKCLEGFHIGECLNSADSTSALQTCEYVLNPERLERARWDEASSTIIKVLTKPCPKCRTSTERAGGCMHMICTRANCGFHWCWVCQGPWERDCMGNHWFG